MSNTIENTEPDQPPPKRIKLDYVGSHIQAIPTPDVGDEQKGSLFPSLTELADLGPVPEELGFTERDVQGLHRILSQFAERPDILSHPFVRRTRIALFFNRRALGKDGKNVAKELLSKAWREVKKGMANSLQQMIHEHDDKKLKGTKLATSRLEMVEKIKQADPYRKLLEMAPDETAGPEVDPAIPSEPVGPKGSPTGPLPGSPPGEPHVLLRLLTCYVCRVRYNVVGDNYFRLCPPCAALNTHKKAHLSSPPAGLAGRTVLLTGARVKIGRSLCLSLLRLGATVIATTRFPGDMEAKYAREEGYAEWKERLHIYRLDLRNLRLVTVFCEYVKEKYERLYAIINNAAQTVARPKEFYNNLFDIERDALDKDWLRGMSADWDSRVLALRGGSMLGGGVARGALLIGPASRRSECTSTGEQEGGDTPVILEGPVQSTPHVFTPDTYDSKQVALDNRTTNSWVQKLGEISGEEAVEVHAINAMAPFIINSALQELLLVPQPDLDASAPASGCSTCERLYEKASELYPEGVIPEHHCDDATAKPLMRFIVNVTAMEGKFSRQFKSANHPHTNMAKASLNMMTRTCASHLATLGIYMTSVDTGWVTDEVPKARMLERQQVPKTMCPIDEWDAAARVLDPILQRSAVNGVFLKDYYVVDW